jgi:hypothetical protein
MKELIINFCEYQDDLSAADETDIAYWIDLGWIDDNHQPTTIGLEVVKTYGS